MTATSVLIYLLVIGYLVYQRIQGRAVSSVRRLFLLPVIVAVLGAEAVSHTHLNTIDIAFTVAGLALSLGLGAARGLACKLSLRDGKPFVRWGTAAVALFAINIGLKLAMDVVCVAVGGTTAGITSSLELAVGLMLAGESLVVLARIHAAGGAYGSVPSGFDGSRSDRRSVR